MKREKASFVFSEKYRDRNYTQQEASVRLEVDYYAKTYSVIPWSSCASSFDFKNNSHQWEMWKAVLKAIDSAIDFANQEVGNTPKEDAK